MYTVTASPTDASVSPQGRRRGRLLIEAAAAAEYYQPFSDAGVKGLSAIATATSGFTSYKSCEGQARQGPTSRQRP